MQGIAQGGAPLGVACLEWGGLAERRLANKGRYFTPLETAANVPLRLLPTPFTTAMMDTAMPEAIRPYSMAVAPDSSLRKVVSLPRIVPILLFALEKPIGCAL